MNNAVHMIPAQHPQMYQQPAQTMSAPSRFQPTHQLMTTNSNRGWLVAGGVHVIYTVGIFVLAFVSALFEPASDYYEDAHLYYSMSQSTFYLMIPAFVVSIVSVYAALNVKCNKLFATLVPPISHFICYLLWCLIAAIAAPSDAEFSDAWEQIFGDDFFEVAVPIITSHLVLCAGMMGLISISSND